MGTTISQLKAILFVSLFTGIAVTAWAEDYDEAVRAYASGDYPRAYKLFLPLAESGHMDAQFHLGLMYDNGLGVDQDPVIAEKWYNRACPLPGEDADAAKK